MEDRSRTREAKLTNSATHAKIANLYTTIKEMYENGSKQSFMTLNLQFIVSQMMAVSASAPEDFAESNKKIKTIITRDAKSFYYEHQKKGFYLIENYIGVVYCLMTLMARSMISTSTGTVILQHISLVDGANLLKSREKVLGNILQDDKLEDNKHSLQTNLFVPDHEISRTFDHLTISTPITPVKSPLGLENQVSIKDDVAIQGVESANMETIVLKPSPFEGNIFTFFNNVLLRGLQKSNKQMDLLKIKQLPTKTEYFQAATGSALEETANEKYMKEVKRIMDARFSSQLQFAPKASKTRFSSPSSFQSPNKNQFGSPTPDSFDSPQSNTFDSPPCRGPTPSTFKTACKLRPGKSNLERNIMARLKEPERITRYVGFQGQKENPKGRYIIDEPRNPAIDYASKRPYRLPSHVKKPKIRKPSPPRPQPVKNEFDFSSIFGMLDKHMGKKGKGECSRK